MNLLRETIYFVALLGVQYGGWRFGIQAVLGFTSGTVCTAAIVVSALFLWTLMGKRKVVSTAESHNNVVGRPMLFPVTITHTRVSPVKNHFSHRLLLVGVPIGFRGHIGPLLSIDQADPYPPHQSTSWRRLFTWFSFDPVRYLHLGDNEHGLREKLDRFLLSQNKDPANWPYAYLISVPRFLYWERSVVSFWYLYSPSLQLDAMIMEINNSFHEKRNVLFELHPELIEPQVKEPEKPTYLDERETVLSFPSSRNAKYYKGIWDKRIFASPFEKVDGILSNRFMDPVQEGSWGSTMPLSTCVAVGPAGETRTIMNMSCQEPPLDPAKATTFNLAKMIFRWTLPATLTTPLIIFEALKIQYIQRLMQMMDRPIIQRGSIARPPTSLERSLETFWRAFLARCVESFSEPLQVIYIPPSSLSTESITLHSPSFSKTASTSVQTLRVEVIDPSFYNRVSNYTDLWDGLALEHQPKGSCADATSRYLLVSDFQLLHRTIDSFQKSEPTSPSTSGSTLVKILAWCRGSPGQMDSFVLSSTPPLIRLRYIGCIMRHVVAHRLAFGSLTLLFVYGLLLRWAILNLALHIYSRMGVLLAPYHWP